MTLCSAWATEEDVIRCGDLTGIYDNSDDLTYFLDVASDLLYQLSGKQFPGACSTSIRPCSRRNGPTIWYRPRYQFGQTTGFPWPGCVCDDFSTWCSCRQIHQIELGVYPLVSIESITIDGVAIPDDEYRIDNHRYLVRLADPSGYNPGWPLCQDMNLPTTDDGTFEVEFTYGLLPPDAGVLAAATLAREFYLACFPEEGKCRIPRNIASIARQGVSVIFERLTRTGGHFRFGLWEVDVFLEAYAPYGSAPQSTIMNPDLLPSVRKTTWEAP